MNAGPAWHILTCEYPPRVGGIGDYTCAIAERLARAGHPVHVWSPEDSGAAPETAGVTVHRVLGAFSVFDCLRAGRALNTFAGRRRLFVQWVPHGYGYKSINLPFALWLAARGWLRGDELHLMIHEPYMRFAAHPGIVAASIVHRLMLAILASGATKIWLSIPTWEPYVRPYVAGHVPIEWLPVPAPAVASEMDAGPPAAGRSTPPIVGHFSTYSRVVTALLEPALDTVLARSDASVRLLGRDSDRFAAQFLATRPALANRVYAAGVVPAKSLGRELASCDVMLQPYPDGINARHTSTLAALACGRPIVTNSGVLTEPFWKDSNAVLLTATDPAALAQAVLDLAGDKAAQAQVSARARTFYDHTFDIRHAVARLLHHSPPPGPVENVEAMGLHG